MASDGAPGDSLAGATAPLTFGDFLEKMRHPQASDLVRAIKSFIYQFGASGPAPATLAEAEEDARRVQSFLENAEAAFKAHPLWAGASADDLESAAEGLEKYLLTKLNARAMAPCPEDAAEDASVSERCAFLASFVRPEHLDIPARFVDEGSWVLAQKELQKVDGFKAPRDKLICLLNCCKIINNLLNVSATGGAPPGADDFLPVLIYNVIKADVPHLHLHLKYVERFRRQSRLVSEAAYFFTNLVSAESFIARAGVDAAALTIDPREFAQHQEAFREARGLPAPGKGEPTAKAKGGGAGDAAPLAAGRRPGWQRYPPAGGPAEHAGGARGRRSGARPAHASQQR